MLIVRIDVLKLRWLWVSIGFPEHFHGFTSEMASHSQYICRVASVLTILNHTHTHTPNFLPRSLSEQTRATKARDLYNIVLVAGDYNIHDIKHEPHRPNHRPNNRTTVAQGIIQIIQTVPLHTSRKSWKNRIAKWPFKIPEVIPAL